MQSHTDHITIHLVANNQEESIRLENEMCFGCCYFIIAIAIICLTKVMNKIDYRKKKCIKTHIYFVLFPSIVLVSRVPHYTDSDL